MPKPRYCAECGVEMGYYATGTLCTKCRKRLRARFSSKKSRRKKARPARIARIEKYLGIKIPPRFEKP